VGCTWIRRNEPEAYAMVQEYRGTLTFGDLPPAVKRVRFEEVQPDGTLAVFEHDFTVESNGDGSYTLTPVEARG
jgi:hypothetical protein